jgi:lactoylglutathione lyase
MGKGGFVDCYCDIVISCNDTVVFIDQISIGFSVDSLDERIREFKEAGIDIYKEPVQPNPHIRFFYVKDPNGVSVQFAQQM